jgi:hypothetical protein
MSKVTIRYNHSCDLGLLDFNLVPFTFTVEARIDQLRPTIFEEGGEDMYALFEHTKRIKDGMWKLTTGFVPSEMVDAFRLLQYCDSVEMEYNDEVFSAERIDVKVDWELPEGDFALITMEFSRGERLKVGTCCEVLIDDVAIFADVAGKNANCYSVSNGEINFTNATGGSGDYECSIDNGATWEEYENPKPEPRPRPGGLKFTGLAVGTYHVWIRDKNNPSITLYLGTITIGQPEQLSVTLSFIEHCWNDANTNGRIYLNAPTGGSGSYQLSLDDATWQDDPFFANLTPGTYTVYLRDKNATACKRTMFDVEIKRGFWGEQDGNCGNATFFFTQTQGNAQHYYTIEYYDGSDWQRITGMPGVEQLATTQAVDPTVYERDDDTFIDHMGIVQYRLGWRFLSFEEYTYRYFQMEYTCME